jgi:hypothetical protein
MNGYSVNGNDGAQIGNIHLRKRHAIGAAITSVLEGDDPTAGADLSVFKNRPGFAPVLRARIMRGSDLGSGLFFVDLSHAAATPLATAPVLIADAPVEAADADAATAMAMDD